MEHLLNMDDLGVLYPYFRKPPYLNVLNKECRIRNIVKGYRKLYIVIHFEVLKNGVPPNHPKSLDHDLILKDMVVGLPILRKLFFWGYGFAYVKFSHPWSFNCDLRAKSIFVQPWIDSQHQCSVRGFPSSFLNISTNEFIHPWAQILFPYAHR